MTSHQIERLIHHLVHVPAVVCDASHGEHRLLPQVLRLDFGNGKIELLAEALFQTGQDLPLVFQRLTVGDEELNPAESNNNAHDATA